jgi:glycosyltransferase involved in cell wall biosynthesis
MLVTYNRLRLVTTPTETAARILRGQKIRVPVLPVSCGVDTHVFVPLPGYDQSAARVEFGLDPHKTLFLYVGRHDGEKRIDLLLRGLALLREQGRSDLQLALAGQGAAKASLQALSRELGLEDRVHFLGYVATQQLPGLYLAADIFAMPSPEELQSIATLEAMASGKPILAADARALPELIAQGVNGRLFVPGSVESAAAGMAALADSRAVWGRMGAASRSRAVAHSLENTITRYEALYHRVSGLRMQRAKEEMRLRTASSD